jgi:N-acetylglucosaminyl-diphospho-decaprenol L-rhamnosyltransferase
VDNNSQDGSAEMVASEFPWVRLMRNQRNVGFGAAHNMALRGAEARHLMVLNSDAQLAAGTARTLVDFLGAEPEVAVVGPKLRHADGSLQPSRRRFPQVATLFMESTQLQRLWPNNRVLRRYYLADKSDDVQQDVDWLAGACLCVRASAAADIGLFDERFFMYSEEIDWCRRFKAAGWRIVYLPSAHVIHQEGASTGQDLALRDQFFQDSKLAYASKWHGKGVARALRVYLMLEYAARAIEESLKLAMGSRVQERRARLRMIGSGLRHALHG